ncbi:hypothetical protein ACQCVK_22465 [Rossellomorea vietnamensis]|uniref:Uncharacterized protein n=1 Tax=Rossellomorea aquimaris TaxID=189382 RepID=A0A5D4U7C1_9BACI|nr:hypothetical protein [Rossellomorea aquimaris]TYS83151.1 hypothetical protein FZC80_02125 [Rossellomorea aquimaris]TYS83152.1 hypothetical protein FZC80_02130 [Rossellomorea aquimaris]
MNLLTLEESTSLLHSYGIKCNKAIVSKWISEGKIKRITESEEILVSDEEIEDFLHWYQWEGTAYEPGIDDQTKIARLWEEVKELRLENNRLRSENKDLLLDREALPF